MKKINKYMLVGLSSMSMLLTACQSDAKEALSINEKIETSKQDLADQFTTLADQEKNLQAQFEKTLEEDETFSTIADESSALFENIKQRTDVLDSMEKTQDEFKNELESYEKLDMKDLPEKEVEAIKKELSDMSQKLTEFIDFYKNTLSKQKEYFSSLAEESSTYETFTSGIDALNENQENVHTKIVELDTTLSSLESKTNEINNQLQDSSDKK